MKVRGSFWIAAVLLAISYRPTPSLGQDASFGVFSANPRVEFIDGRNVKLLESLSFTDAKKRVWQVPKDFVSDGASIPQAFWSFIGGPLDGPYRNAALVHDYFCELQTYDWRQVALVFFNAMRAAGTERAKAWVMYEAVNYFGPRWVTKKKTPDDCVSPSTANDCVLNTSSWKMPAFNQNKFSEFLDHITANGHKEEADELRSEVKF